MTNESCRVPRPRSPWRKSLALLAAAPGLLPGACGRGGDAGNEGAAFPDGEVGPQAADTVAVAPRADIDDPGSVSGFAEAVDGPAGADEPADTTARSQVGDSAAVSARSVQLRVPAGTQVRLAAETDISTDVHRVGDPVIAKVVQEVVDRTGEVLIPQGAYFLGRVEASAGSGGIGEPPILEVAFETLSAWTYERPVESVVVDAAVTLDPEADRTRQSARYEGTVVPGRIMAGSVIVLQLREPVFVPPFDPLALPENSPDTVPRASFSATHDPVCPGDPARGGMLPRAANVPAFSRLCEDRTIRHRNRRASP